MKKRVACATLKLVIILKVLFSFYQIPFALLFCHQAILSVFYLICRSYCICHATSGHILNFSQTVIQILSYFFSLCTAIRTTNRNCILILRCPKSTSDIFFSTQNRKLQISSCKSWFLLLNSSYVRKVYSFITFYSHS